MMTSWMWIKFTFNCLLIVKKGIKCCVSEVFQYVCIHVSISLMLLKQTMPNFNDLHYLFWLFLLLSHDM